MDDQLLVYGTAAVLLSTVVFGVFRKSFDPFAPLWMFLTGYFQIYVVQAISYRDYAIRARGADLVTLANGRALWALVWFLAVYHCGIARYLAARLPRPPAHLSPTLVCGISPFLIVWGLICAGVAMTSGEGEPASAEEALFRSFPIIMLVAAILLIVAGRHAARPFRILIPIGLGVAVFYAAIWILNGKRSPPLFGVLATICAFYVSKGQRPSKAVLTVTALVGMMVVSVAIGWRNTRQHDRSLSGFVDFLSHFDVSTVLVNINAKDGDEDAVMKPGQGSKETEEYGGFLLMMDTVPERSEYDYGSNYLRIFSTYIPRIVWPNKPLYGREQWVNAWIAGSEFQRKSNFTGPAIGILGATQLNGGAVGTFLVLGVVALLIRVGYDYFRLYRTVPLGTGLVVADLLQRLADDGQRRPVRLVLLHLQLHHRATDGVPLDLPHARTAGSRARRSEWLTRRRTPPSCRGVNDRTKRTPRMNMAICFTNFGPYHLARLRALARELREPAGGSSPTRSLGPSGAILGSLPGSTRPSSGSLSSPTAPWRRSRDRPAAARSGTPWNVTAPRRWRSSAIPGPSRWPRFVGRGAWGGPQS